MTTVVVRISDRQRELLRTEALKKRKSIAAIVREALAGYTASIGRDEVADVPKAKSRKEAVGRR